MPGDRSRRRPHYRGGDSGACRIGPGGAAGCDSAARYGGCARSLGPTVVACPKAGACTAGGTFYDDRVAGSFEVWVANESGYTWGNGVELAGLRLGGGFSTTLHPISCTPPGHSTPPRHLS